MFHASTTLTCLLTLCAAPRAAFGADLLDDLSTAVERVRGIGGHGAVLVAAGDEVVFEAAFGSADRESGTPMSPETVFSLGSITKSFTAVAILRLEAEGALSVEDTLGEHFSGVPADRREITLHQLLTHTAGMPDGLGDDWDLDGTREKLLADALRAPLVTRPGTEFHYSNVGYSLLGMIVEDVSGMPYETYLRQTFFLPLGMRRTGYLGPDYAEQELAVGYRAGERWGMVLSRPMLEDGPSWHLRANGGLHTTLGDMQRWATALQGESVLSAAAKEKAFTPWIDEGGGSTYGYGFEVGQLDEGRRKVGHSGGNGIFSTYFRLYPEDGLMLIVTSTVAEVSVRYLMPIFEGALFGTPMKLPPATVELDGQTLAQFAGSYATQDGALIEIEATPTGLAVSPGNAAGKNLLAGEEESPLLRELARRTEEALQRAHEGDYAPLHRAYGIEASLAEFEQDQRGMQEELAAQLGPFQGVEIVEATSVGSGADIAVRFDHEDGELLLVMRWRDGAIGEIRQVEDVPTPRVEVFPMSPLQFEAFNLSGFVPLRVTFPAGEQAPDELALERSGTRVQATRR